MVRLTLFILFAVSTLTSFAHEFYFSFAEVSYNEFEGKLEISVAASAHDIDLYLEKKGIHAYPLEKKASDSSSKELLQQLLNKHLIFDSNQENSITEGSEMIFMQLEGTEVLLNGQVYFYLSAKISQIPNELKIRFDLLMDEYSGQQNKMTIYFRDIKKDLIFLKQEPVQILNFNAKNE
jgi:hypothetical protein